MKEKSVDPSQRPGRRFSRLAIVLAGIVAGQFLLYGPSLTGRKVLLPLNFLAVKNCYLPNTVQTPNSDQDPVPSDLVLVYEPDRRFAISESLRGPFSRMDTGQVWRGSIYLFQVLALLSVHLSGGITRHPRVGTIPRRAGCGRRRLFILPACAPSEFLAGDPRRLVLPDDRFFCFLARRPYLHPGLLAALAAVGS